ncbi:MAG: zinc-dependent alcohol dehydrogenase family protein [Candidatus Bathyarchaeia archaeon]
MSNMNAAVFRGVNNLVVEDRPIPKIDRPDDVILEIYGCGICGTDPKIIAGEHPVKNGIVLGHEYAGTVAKIGDKVKNVKVGDRVAVDVDVKCGSCYYCRTGRDNLCQNIITLGEHEDGGYAKYNRSPASSLYKIPDEMTLDAAILAGPISCVVNTVQRANVRPGQSVGIIGAGPMGLHYLQLLKSSQAGSLVVYETKEERIANAKKFGAKRIINPSNEDAVKATKDLTEGRGLDVIIEAAGAPSATKLALAMIGRGGRIVQFGINPQGAEVSIQPFDFTFRQIEYIGSFISNYSFAAALDLLSAGKFEVDKFITHRLKVSDVNQGMDLMRKGECIKVMIVPD